jgi:hypothetical protein
MGSFFSKSSLKTKEMDENLRKEFYGIFTNLHRDCQISAGACYYSAERHENIARLTDRVASAFGVLSAGGFGLMHFYKVGLTPKGKGILGGTSTVLAACFALSSLLNGIRDTSRSPAVLSVKYNETAAEWDELQHLLEVYRKIKVRDPRVNVSELEMMSREILRRRKEIALKVKVEEWAFKKMIKEEAMFEVELKDKQDAIKKDETIVKEVDKS